VDKELMKRVGRRLRPPLPKPASGSSCGSWSKSKPALDDVALDRLDQKIGQVIGERPSKQKLHRQLIHLLRIFMIVGLPCQQPALRQQIAQCTR
jgi:hypothetical protein